MSVMHLGLFDDAQPAAGAPRVDGCRSALQDLAEAVDRYLLGAPGESPSEATIEAARHEMIASLEQAWDILRPIPRLRAPSGGSGR